MAPNLPEMDNAAVVPQATAPPMATKPKCRGETHNARQLMANKKRGLQAPFFVLTPKP
jgi:hypothetical protein